LKPPPTNPRVPLLRAEGKVFSEGYPTLGSTAFVHAPVLLRESRSNTARDAEASFGFEPSLYFYVGFSHPSFGDAVLVYPPESFDLDQGGATPFDGVVLYAAHELIGPGEPDRVILDPTPLCLRAEPFVWAGYMPLADAIRLLRGWGKKLILDGKAQLLERTRAPDRRLAGERALNDACRARFCLSPRDSPEPRYEMFRVMAMATRVLEQPLESVYLDAAIDFPDQVDRLRSDVEALVPRERTASDRQVQPFGRSGYGPRIPPGPLGAS
jgi:hypothetical protein